MTELSQGSSQTGHIIHQNIALAGLHYTIKLWAQGQALHRVCTRMVNLRHLNNRLVSRRSENHGTNFSQHLRNRVIATGFSRKGRHKNAITGKLMTVCINTCQSEIRNQCQRAPPITSFGIDIGRMRL